MQDWIESAKPVAAAPSLVAADDCDDTGLSDDDWRRLLNAIGAKRCTPFLGAGASAHRIRMASTVAEQWARETRYPLRDSTDLIKVAQYLKVRFGSLDPRVRMVAECDIPRPMFGDHELYSVLAELPIPVFMTTNYDSLLWYALESKGKRPVREICRWNSALSYSDDDDQNLTPAFRANEKQPLVFHLHGHFSNLESMVLTEDDYLDFLINLTEKRDLLPPRLQRVIADGCMLFLGYSLSDWNFQVVFRNIARYLEHSRLQNHVSVQLIPLGPSATRQEREEARRFLGEYFKQQRVCVYWGTCDRFAGDLLRRWQEYRSSAGGRAA